MDYVKIGLIPDRICLQATSNSKTFCYHDNCASVLHKKNYSNFISFICPNKDIVFFTENCQTVEEKFSWEQVQEKRAAVFSLVIYVLAPANGLLKELPLNLDSAKIGLTIFQ